MFRTMSLIPVGAYVLQGMFPQSCWCIRSLRTMSPITLVHTFSKDYVPDPWQVIFPPTTMYLFNNEAFTLSVAIMTCYFVQLTRRVGNRKYTTKYDHRFFVCLFISTYKYTLYHHYYYSWPEDQKVWRRKTVVSTQNKIHRFSLR